MKEQDVRKALELIDQRAALQQELAQIRARLGKAMDVGGVQIRIYLSDDMPLYLELTGTRELQSLEDCLLTLWDGRLDKLDRALEELGVEV